MFNKILFVIVLLQCCAFANAQEAPLKLSHNVNIGTVFRQSKDYCLNSTRYQGLGIQGSYTQRRLVNEGFFDFTLNVKYSKLKNRYDFLPASFYVSPGLSFRYAKRAFKKSDQYKAYFGGQLSTQPNIWFYALWDDSHLYWFTHNDLSFYHYAQIPFKNTFFEFALSIPILSLVSRPPAWRNYKMDKRDANYIVNTMYSNMKWQTFNHFQGLNVELGFRYRVNSKFEHRIVYRCNLARITALESDKLVSIDHGLSMVLILNKYEK